MKTVHAAIRIKTEDHHLSLNIDFEENINMYQKFLKIADTISANNYLQSGNARLESIYFYESEDTQ